MNAKSKINIFRKKLRNLLFKISPFKKTKENNFNLDISQVKRILISRPNHRLGNILLLTPIVQELRNIFPNASIDIVLKGNLGYVVFENYIQVSNIIKLEKKPFDNLFKYFIGWTEIFNKTYDIAISAGKKSSSGNIAIMLSKAKYKFYNIENQTLHLKERYFHNALNPIYNFRSVLLNSNDGLVFDSYPRLKINLRDYEIENGSNILNKIFNNNKKTIGIFTYATGDKCFSKLWWNIFYREIIKLEPEYNLLEILPKENVSQINFSLKTYYSNDIREISSVMHNLHLFIGADSGLMHLASASNTQTIGLFNITEPEFYGVYGENNLSFNSKENSMLELFSEIDKII